MSKSLFDEENGQNIPPSLNNTAKNMQKKQRPKFTILDDMQELNQIINGPGANEQSIKAQEMIHKTYQCMKGNQTNQEERAEMDRGMGQDQNKISRKKQKSRVYENKENQDIINISKYQNNDHFEQLLKCIKGPRIIVTMKKIDLQNQCQKNDLRVKGFEKFIFSQNFLPETRAPANSFQDEQESMLFSAALALQNTDRYRMKNSHQCNPKGISFGQMGKR